MIPLFLASSFGSYLQLLLERTDNNLGCGFDRNFGGVDGYVLIQRVTCILTKLATGQPRSVAIRFFDHNLRCLQAQFLTGGDPLDSHLDRRNHPNPQTELTGQNVLCAASDDDHVSLVTQGEKNFVQVSQVAGHSDGLRVEQFDNGVLNCRPIALIQTFD